MFQAVINGVSNGLVLAVLAIAFFLVYTGTKVFYIGLAGIYALVPFVTLGALKMGVHWTVAILGGIAVGIAVSAACEVFNHAPLERRGVSWAGHLVSSLGIYIVITQIISVIWDNELHVLPGNNSAWSLGVIVISETQVLATACALIAIISCGIWLKISRTGLYVRALATNATELSLRGYSTARLRLVIFCMAGLFASIAALLTARDIGFDATSSLNAIFLAFAAMIIGGGGSVAGAVLGAVVLGVVRSVTVWSMSARWEEPVTFAILVLFLLFWSHGLLGRSVTRDAE